MIVKNVVKLYRHTHIKHQSSRNNFVNPLKNMEFSIYYFKMWTCLKIIHNYRPTQFDLTNSTQTVVLLFLLNTTSTNC